MTKRILAFAGSNHATSINHQLIEYTAPHFSEFEVEVLDIRGWDIPVYSIDMDPDQTPELIQGLIERIKESDAFIISSPEHNGGTPAFFKNIIDWLSRREKKVFEGKPVLLMSTSPGGRGGATNLEFLNHTLPYQGALISETYSLPSFYDNFKDGEVIGDQVAELQQRIDAFKELLVR